MKTFKCVEVEGDSWLVADMRLQCYRGDWYGYALYAFVMGLLFTAGLPAVILVILLKNRMRLSRPAVLEKWGFLYEVRLQTLNTAGLGHSTGFIVCLFDMFDLFVCLFVCLIVC